ncbi:hypothetical protein BDZ97DRAFT_1903908 [Flammula alnicola]|nr:hypothetical protein BDZ97DRAFT_1903908 [Flammula alnicola]
MASLVVGASIASGALGYLIAQQRHTARTQDRAITELRRTLTREGHGFSESDYLPGAPHSVVVYPESTEDVVRIVKIATKYRMPVIPYSGATSLEGHFRGHSSGGICVDLNHMDQILEIHEDDSDLVCQPAARWMDINDVLKKKGTSLFYLQIDPGPGATIGGMLSTGCSGTNAVRYGTAKGEWFLNATVVLPSGEVIKTRRRSRKSAAGFDVTKLFVGAEGTLGIVTEVTIRLAPVLPTTVAVVHFPDMRSATAASIEVINQGVGIRTYQNYGISSRKWLEKDSLFFKFQGPSQASLKETASVVQRIVAKHGGTGFSLAKNEKEAEDIWQDRKNLYYSGLSLVESRFSTEIYSKNASSVPVSKLPELIYETKKDLDQVGLVSTIVGHVGDGNFHALLLFKTDEELEIARKAASRIVHRAIALDGTCTGEHGVGLGKKQYLTEELGQGTVDLMKTIKRSIDPLLYPDPPPSKLPGRSTTSSYDNSRYDSETHI